MAIVICHSSGVMLAVEYCCCWSAMYEGTWSQTFKISRLWVQVNPSALRYHHFARCGLHNHFFLPQSVLVTALPRVPLWPGQCGPSSKARPEDTRQQS